MGEAQTAQPQILVPYPGAMGDGSVQDIFIYLRPETNGVLVESMLLKVIQGCSQFKTDIKLVYLANFPGDFILENHIIERHYSHKFFFAVHGKRAFTSRIKAEFEAKFGEPLGKATVIGSFEALGVLKLKPEELFALRVPAKDVLLVEGQTIKKIRGHYVVNYDMPALLHKNNRGTDIAVMMFRCSVDYEYFVDLVDEMRDSLVKEGILRPNQPASRAFHYSKGPFEQLLDAIDYLRTPAGEMVPVDELSFVQYAGAHGCTSESLLGVVRCPICTFEGADGTLTEENIFAYTRTDSYEAALEKLRAIRSQLWIR